LSKRTGAYDYNPVSVVVVSELSKFCLAIVLFFTTVSGATVKQVTDFAPIGYKYWVPALVYAVYNNLTFIILTHFNPTSWRVLLNLRIVWTGILYQILFGTKLSAKKWVCLCITMFMSMLFTGDRLTWDGLPALSLIFLQTFVSSLGAVYYEWILKNNKTVDVHSQNIYMYAIGTCFNVLFMIIMDPSTLDPAVFFRNYNWELVPVIGISAFGGVLISLVLKYMDSVWKLFLDVAQMFVVFAIDVIWFDEVLMANKVLMIMVVAAASLYYNYDDEDEAAEKLKKGEKVKADEESIEQEALLLKEGGGRDAGGKGASSASKLDTPRARSATPQMGLGDVEMGVMPDPAE
jgi:hypothetical protein